MKNISHLIFHYQIVWDVQNLQMFNPKNWREKKTSGRKMAFNSILFPQRWAEKEEKLSHLSFS
jgi:hypothetical protein